MASLRRLIGPFTAVWLVLQVAGVTTTSIAFAITDPNECTCGHGDHAMCPMHHWPTIRQGRCAMRSTDAGDAALVSTVLMPPAVMPSGESASLHDAASPAAARNTSRIAAGYARTLSPPPRA